MKSVFTPILLLFFMLFNANAQVLDINQLFNKKLTQVKEEKVGIIKSFYGTTQIDESAIVDIVLRFDGFVTKLHANKTLMPIHQGEALFSIYSDKVLSIHKELQISFKINKSLYASALDKLSALDLHDTQIKRLKTNKKLNDIDIIAPVNAIVLSKKVNKGSYIKKGQAIMQLANIDALWFTAQVYQKDLSFIKKGMKARVKLDGLNNSYKTTVDYIYPFIDKKKKTVDVRFIINNKDAKLYPNMFGSVKLQNAKRSMLTLPKTAVLTKGGKYYVFKPISKEEFEPIEVEAVRISASKYEIIEGLKAGESVVNNALFLLDSDAVTNGLYESEDDDDW